MAPGCRQRPNSYSLHAKVFESKNSNMKLSQESKTATVFDSRLALTKECRAPVVSVSDPTLSVSRPGSVCVGPQRSVSGPSAVCVGPRRCSVSGSGTLRPSLCRGLLLSVSGPGALYVGARRSLYPGAPKYANRADFRLGMF